MFPKAIGLVVTDKNHTRITVGFDHLEKQIPAPRTVSRLCRRFPARIETVNLLVQRNIPVTFMETSSGSNQRHDRSGGNAADHESNSSGASAGESEREGPPAPGMGKNQDGPQPFSLQKQTQKGRKE